MHSLSQAIARTAGRAVLAGCILVGSVIVAGGARVALSSDPPVMRLDPPTIKLDNAVSGTVFTVDVVIEEVTDLGAFEFEVGFDTDFFKLIDIRVGPFLLSTGRHITCQTQMTDGGSATLGCNTANPAPPGASGSGVLASLDFSVQGYSFGDTSLILRACNASDVLGVDLLGGICKGSKVALNPPTPTPSPTPRDRPRIRKLPTLQNRFLTRQGDKVPPPDCLSSGDAAKLEEALDQAIISPDQKGGAGFQELAAFEFEVNFDGDKVCVTLAQGVEWVNANAICAIEDAATKPTLEGVARIGCVTIGKDLGIDETQPLATIMVRPQPEVYSQAKPNQENGVVVQINNVGCNLADEQGHPIASLSCEDADITFRYLEGDVEPDCVVDAVDAQSIAFRWGATKGNLVYSDFYNLEPSGTQSDNDIDIKDLQFVFGRFGSTCQAPHPPQDPVNPKGGSTPTPTATLTPSPTPTPSNKPRVNTVPTLQTLFLSSPPQSQRCADSPDAATFDVQVKDPIASPDPKDPAQLQQLGAFEFEIRFDPLLVCVEVAPGEIPDGEMNCLTFDGQDLIRFGCKTSNGGPLAAPQPPGVLAVITVRPQPDVYAQLVPGQELIAELTAEGCKLSDLLGHAIKRGECGGASLTIRYP